MSEAPLGLRNRLMTLVMWPRSLKFFVGKKRGLKNSWEGNIEPVNPLTPATSTTTTTTLRPPRKNSELSVIWFRGINIAVFCFLVKYCSILLFNSYRNIWYIGVACRCFLCPWVQGFTFCGRQHLFWRYLYGNTKLNAFVHQVNSDSFKFNPTGFYGAFFV